MGDSMRKALERAYAAKGQEVPQTAKKATGHGQLQDVRKTGTTVAPGKGAPKNGQSRTASSAGRIKINPRSAQSIARLQDEMRNLSDVYGGGKSRAKQTISADSRADNQPLSSWAISTGPSAQVHPFLQAKVVERSLLATHTSGIAEQLHEADESRDVRELAIGLDFGTSSVKVIVGDRAAQQAFAVPFFDAQGIDTYLLPSRLWETAGHYSLESGATAHQNLKLSLLARGDTSAPHRRATAFLALILRHVRAWLFTQHAEIYKGVRIVWKLVLGMPAENYEDKLLVGRFHALARSAWILAGKHHKEISADVVDQAIVRVSQLENGDPANTASEEVEVDVVPELSAQIYGFLQSNRFDRKNKNIFVMVDVGAGTVDSALFHVKREHARWHFEFFTNNVQPYGAMNLHRTRVDWWSRAFQNQPVPPVKLLEGLSGSELPTDQAGAIPERLEDYFSDVTLRFNDIKMNPDTEFFKNVVAQVRGRTIYRASTSYKKENGETGFLSKADLENVPLFLCGGGSRLHFYHRLEEELRHFPGCTWLKAQPQVLEIPKDLKAPSLTRQEYDRLSVAYGLSFLDVGKIVKALPPPVAPSLQGPSWHFTDRFVDKDQV